MTECRRQTTILVRPVSSLEDGGNGGKIKQKVDDKDDIREEEDADELETPDEEQGVADELGKPDDEEGE